jgi:quercetin dioxygenase-like cupin family protein
MVDTQLPDAVQATPHVYSVLLENERVRVLEVHGVPGDRTELHHHPAQVAVAVTAALYRFTAPDGTVTEAKLEPGMAMYVDAVDHSTEIGGDPGSRVLLIELKDG